MLFLPITSWERVWLVDIVEAYSKYGPVVSRRIAGVGALLGGREFGCTVMLGRFRCTMVQRNPLAAWRHPSQSRVLISFALAGEISIRKLLDSIVYKETSWQTTTELVVSSHSGGALTDCKARWFIKKKR
jgi:hypothetical protein